MLGALVVIYMFNIDRILPGSCRNRSSRGSAHQPSARHLAPPFALLFTLGLPIARWAEREPDRIIALGAAVWSLFTAACGFAQNYLQLLLARIGVGIGEAACVPPSHSVISDYFPADRRASALSIYALGIPIGSGIAAIGGGWLTQNFDWRSAFWLLGAPGLLAALLLKLTVREPPRMGGAAVKAPNFGETLKILAGKPSFWHNAMGGALIAACGYGTLQFLVSHLVRNYDLGANLQDEIAHASYVYGAYAGISMGIGTFLGGFLADRLAPKHTTALTWLPAVGLLLAAPLYLASYVQTELVPALAFLLIAPIVHFLYAGPYFAVAQSVSPPRARATATAVLVFIGTLLDTAFSLVGFANDFFSTRSSPPKGSRAPPARTRATPRLRRGGGVRFALCADCDVGVPALGPPCISCSRAAR